MKPWECVWWLPADPQEDYSCGAKHCAGMQRTSSVTRRCSRGRLGLQVGPQGIKRRLPHQCSQVSSTTSKHTHTPLVWIRFHSFQCCLCVSAVWTLQARTEGFAATLLLHGSNLPEAIAALISCNLFKADILLQLRSGPPLNMEQWSWSTAFL